MLPFSRGFSLCAEESLEIADNTIAKGVSYHSFDQIIMKTFLLEYKSIVAPKTPNPYLFDSMSVALFWIILLAKQTSDRFQVSA